MGNRPNVTITISRQMGSGGSYIGRLAARRLGFRYLDKEILYEAARRLGTDERFLADRDQKSSGFLDNFLRTLPYGNASVNIPPAGPPISDSDLFSLECTIMEEIARRESSVIVGRGAFQVLRGLPGTLRIFMHAPMEFRTDRIMQVQDLTDVQQAESKLKKSDRRKSRFVWDMLHVRWADATNYHLCVDTSVTDFDSITQLICRMAEGIKQALTG
jgi:cytidylate kinase